MMPGEESRDFEVRYGTGRSQTQTQTYEVSRLDDIAGFRSTRATTIQDNHAFWKRVLTAYGNEAMKEFTFDEENQQNARMKRIKSAPVFGPKENKKRSKLLPKRCQSVQDWGKADMRSVNGNRAANLRLEYISQLHSLNQYSAMTRMSDYQENMRSNRPSHSARYPRFIHKQKADNDPEWGTDEYDVYIFNSKSDSKWVSTWLKGPLEAKRFNVKMRATAKDFDRSSMGARGLHRIIVVLTPDFTKKDMHMLEDVSCYSYALVIKLKRCQFPKDLNFTSYVDLSFKDMTDLTLQSKLLSKLVATLQLPKPICS